MGDRFYTQRGDNVSELRYAAYKARQDKKQDIEFLLFGDEPDVKETLKGFKAGEVHLVTGGNETGKTIADCMIGVLGK